MLLVDRAAKWWVNKNNREITITCTKAANPVGFEINA